jgi:hypothetical protein
MRRLGRLLRRAASGRGLIRIKSTYAGCLAGAEQVHLLADRAGAARKSAPCANTGNVPRDIKMSAALWASATNHATSSDLAEHSKGWAVHSEVSGPSADPEAAPLVEELKRVVAAKSRDLTEALEYQTAISEVLRIISSSPSDAQPVFDTIAKSVARPCKAVVGQSLTYCHVFRFDGGLVHLAAVHGLSSVGVEHVQQNHPMRPGRGAPRPGRLSAARLSTSRMFSRTLITRMDQPRRSSTIAASWRSARYEGLYREKTMNLRGLSEGITPSLYRH